VSEAGAPAIAQAGIDVLIVSLGSTGGLRAVDEELLASLRRAGATAEIVAAAPQPATRTLMLTDLRWALAARRAAQDALARTDPRAIIYSTTTAALLWPRAGAIRFDAPSAGNRPGRHGLWQRPLERRRLREAPLLLPQSEGALHEVHGSVRKTLGRRDALVLPVPVEPSGPHSRHGGAHSGGHPEGRRQADEHRDIAAVTYAANPAKKGLDLLLDAWRKVRREGEELHVAGATEGELRALGYGIPAEGVRIAGMLSREDYRALLRRARVYACAARREDYGVAQLEALADGCMLVTTPSPGPYVALPIARELDGRLVDGDIGAAVRVALDDPVPGYAERAAHLLAPFSRAEVDRQVADELLPRLLSHG
jgi:glycosyltransferase involved in cell wall biosynthesis